MKHLLCFSVLLALACSNTAERRGTGSGDNELPNGGDSGAEAPVDGGGDDAGTPGPSGLDAANNTDGNDTGIDGADGSSGADAASDGSDPGPSYPSTYTMTWGGDSLSSPNFRLRLYAPRPPAGALKSPSYRLTLGPPGGLK